MLLMALNDHLATITKFSQAARLLGAGAHADRIVGTWATEYLGGN